MKPNYLACANCDKVNCDDVCRESCVDLAAANAWDTLNDNERRVFCGCVEVDDCDGVNFQLEDVTVDGLGKKQVIGYLGDLTRKGVIQSFDDCYYSGGFTELGVAMKKIITK